MSARMLAVLRCDHEGCDQRFAWSDESTTWKPPRLGDARAHARAEGWRHGVRLRPDSGRPLLLLGAIVWLLIAAGRGVMQCVQLVRPVKPKLPRAEVRR